MGKAGTAAPGETPRSTLADSVARYEAEATTLGAIPLDDPRRAASHLNHQASGDALRDELGAAPQARRGTSGPGGSTPQT